MVSAFDMDPDPTIAEGEKKVCLNRINFHELGSIVGLIRGLCRLSPILKWVSSKLIWYCVFMYLDF